MSSVSQWLSNGLCMLSNLLLFVNDAGTFVFKNDAYISGDSAVSTANDFRPLEMYTGNAAVSVDRITVIGGEDWGWRRASYGANGPYSMGTTGVSMTLDNQSFPGYVSCQRVSSTPPGMVTVWPLGHYWVLGGMSGKTFTANDTFSYTDAELAAAGAGESSLRVFRSTNNGTTWTQQTPSTTTSAAARRMQSINERSLTILATPSRRTKDHQPR